MLSVVTLVSVSVCRCAQCKTAKEDKEELRDNCEKYASTNSESLT